MIRCYTTTEILVRELAIEFFEFLAKKSMSASQGIYIAISGGKTPKDFFAQLAVDMDRYRNLINWNSLHIFWADERCVPATHKDSNFGMFREVFLSKIQLPLHIHPVKGENDPDYEALRYASEIRQVVPADNQTPVFDWIFLGVGEDGHTASIFPQNTALLRSDEICEAVNHPQTGQIRISLTGKILEKSDKITFLVTGASKRNVVDAIINNKTEAVQYPAYLVTKLNKRCDWYLDKDAAPENYPLCD